MNIFFIILYLQFAGFLHLVRVLMTFPSDLRTQKKQNKCGAKERETDENSMVYVLAFKSSKYVT